jgi:hypothetical protein
MVEQFVHPSMIDQFVYDGLFSPFWPFWPFFSFLAFFPF